MTGPDERVHPFRGDDALGDHDAVAPAAMVRRREVSAGELTAAASWLTDQVRSAGHRHPDAGRLHRIDHQSVHRREEEQP